MQCTTRMDIGERVMFGQTTLVVDGNHRFRDLTKPMLEQGYDCAFGSRFVRGGVVRDYPRDTTASASALFLLADLATDRRDAEARTLFRRLVARYPSSRFAPPARFRAALIAFTAGRASEAAREFDVLAGRSSAAAMMDPASATGAARAASAAGAAGLNHQHHAVGQRAEHD